MSYTTLEQSVKWAKSVVVLNVEVQYEQNGQANKWIKVRKSNGKKVFRVRQYPSGLYSEAV